MVFNVFMITKILSFIYSRKNNKCLLLKNNGADPIHGGEHWFTVTGSVEKEDKGLEETVAREMLEEINLAPIKIINLNTKNEYYSDFDKEDCIEYNFFSVVNSDKIELDNIEHTDFLWCDIDDFIEKLCWTEDKQELKEQLLSEINNLDITSENIDMTYLPYGKEVEVYILNENKEFIIVFSALEGAFCKVLAGGVEKGETFEEAAIREAKEELGIDIEIIGISKHPHEWDMPKESLFTHFLKSRGGKGKSIIAKLNPSHQLLKMQVEEISGYKWIRKEKIYQHIGKLDQLVQAEKIFKEFRELF